MEEQHQLQTALHCHLAVVHTEKTKSINFFTWVVPIGDMPSEGNGIKSQPYQCSGYMWLCGLKKNGRKITVFLAHQNEDCFSFKFKVCLQSDGQKMIKNVSGLQKVKKKNQFAQTNFNLPAWPTQSLKVRVWIKLIQFIRN
eukprot:Seg858.2 transcript_id=Seg858.2/GoldUCD/mRNA.D3Y31 product="hypothetical protein" protein_id=Seg858.2/GoldUCD/D3Y31